LERVGVAQPLPGAASAVLRSVKTYGAACVTLAGGTPNAFRRRKNPMYLGIADDTALVYEGTSSMPERVVVPTPTVTQAKLIGEPDDWNQLSGGIKNNPHTWVFREDSFDAVTRTRRGRLYEAIDGMAYPNHSCRVLPHPVENTGYGVDGRIARPLHVYMACSAMLNMLGRGRGSTLALGNSQAASAWRVVDCEVTVAADVMVTLRAKSAFGIVPELDDTQIDPRFRVEVTDALRKVLDSAFRESPTSVVDRCKDALALIMSRWIWQQTNDERVLGKDIAEVAKALDSHKKFVAANMGKTLGILHARGKSNEQFAKNVRAPTEEDAEFALNGLALAIRDLGWAR
jgi:hypothetical protein